MQDTKQQKPTILFVDDDSELFDLISLKLERKGMHADFAVSAQEGIDLYDPDKHQAVVVDRFMPGLDGYQFIEHLMDRFPSAQVIMASGAPEEGKLAMAKGASAYIVKGLNLDYLDEVVSLVRNSQRP